MTTNKKLTAQEVTMAYLRVQMEIGTEKTIASAMEEARALNVELGLERRPAATTGGGTDDITVELSEKQGEALGILRGLYNEDSEAVTLTSFQEALDVSEPTATARLKELVELGVATVHQQGNRNYYTPVAEA